MLNCVTGLDNFDGELSFEIEGYYRRKGVDWAT
jgi:hypothetical protein